MRTSEPFISRPLIVALVIFASPRPADAAQGRLLFGNEQGVFSSINVFDAITQAEVSSAIPYASSFLGGLRVAAGDVNDDGTPDIIVGSGVGLSHVKVFSGKDGSTLHTFLPYGDGFTGGIFVATGDVDGDGVDDIVTGAGTGGGHVKVFDGRTGAELASFFAFSPSFVGGVRVACGDVDGDGRADIIVGTGSGGGHVKVFSGKSGAEIHSFAPYDPQFMGGVFVAAGDLNGDGLADIFTGADAGGSPHVKVFNGRSGAEMRSFRPFPPTFTGGVRVAAGDIDGDKIIDLIAAGGPDEGTVKVLSGKTGEEIRTLAPYGGTYRDGIYVASADFNGDGLQEIITGVEAGADGGHVKVFDGRTGAELNTFDAFPTTFTGGVRVAMGDVDGDGASDFITGSGPGAAHVKAFSGRDGSELASFHPYGGNFSGGIYVASGDVNGDGRDDIITGAGPGGGPHVKVFDGQTGDEIRSFPAYSPTFSGGVPVATGDVDGDGRIDIITGSATGATHVKVFSGKSGAEIRSFNAYDPQFTGGVFVGAGDVNGDGFAEVITGAAMGIGGHVKVFDGRSEGRELHSFFAFPGFSGGVRVAAADLDGDGRHEIVLAPGPGIPPRVRVLDGLTLKETATFLAFAETTTNGVFVAAGSQARPAIESRFDAKARTLTLRWPVGCNGELETNVDPVHADEWKPVEIRPVQVGNRLEATVPVTQDREFFRLRCLE